MNKLVVYFENIILAPIFVLYCVAKSRLEMQLDLSRNPPPPPPPNDWPRTLGHNVTTLPYSYLQRSEEAELSPDGIFWTVL